MNSLEAQKQLITLLRELGVRVAEGGSGESRAGFPFSFPVGEGNFVTLDLASPGPLAFMDPDYVGVAVLDPLGCPRRTWGLARRVGFLRTGQSIIDSPIGGLLESGVAGGPAVLYLDGFRYFTAPVRTGDAEEAGVGMTDVFLLITNAQEERQARRSASRSERFANALKRLGKVLTMNQTTSQICVAAAHEIASATELAGVLMWTPGEDECLHLAASIGVNRLGNNAVQHLDPRVGSSCVAEMVACSKQAFQLSNVLDHVMTANLEAKFCYLKPGGIAVHPLVISDRLLGVIELVGKEGDNFFEEHRELFETFAEHLALALNAASLYETAEKRASHDALTGIANHRTMQEFLFRRINEADRVGQEVGLIMVDVDHFRSFNEEEGHDAGDQVLKQVSDILASCVRPYDLAARYGGEEFTIIMPGSSRDSTLFVAERVRSRIESLPFATRSGRERHITASLGCATFPHTATESGRLLRAADAALFEAKRSGRNKVVFFEGQMDEEGRNNVPEAIPVEKYICDAVKGESQALFDKLSGDVVLLTQRLPLSAPQVAILEALIKIIPSYRVARADKKQLRSLERNTDFRLLIPSLHALEERFDGRGSRKMEGRKIPLLARVLHVLLALEEEGGTPLLDDPARFDPEIVDLLADLRHAA